MENFFRIAIVENDGNDADHLLSLLERYFESCHETHEVKVYANAFEFVDEATDYNLIFMDIEMPGLSGMEASFKIRQNGASAPLIVFVTNMAQFAIDGYKVNALDYCLKPITYEDLFIPMEKARSILKSTQDKTLAIKTKFDVVRLRVSDIIYIEMVAHDIHIVYQKEGEEGEIRYRGALKSIEESLEGTTLVRINSGCFINVNFFESYNAAQSYAVMKNGASFPVSRSNRRSFLTAITRSGL